jgi:hypothetical protein
MFRKLYFITEQSDATGAFRATGIYTSMHDLMDSGLRRINPSDGGFRITLSKLDCRGDILGSWTGPKFDGLEEDISAFVSTGEFALEELRALRSALDGFAAQAVSA